MLNIQDLLIQKLKNNVLEQLKGDPDFEDNLDMIVFMTKISDKGKMKLVKTMATNKQGKKKEVSLGTQLKPESNGKE